MKMFIRPESQFPPPTDMEFFQRTLRERGWLVIASDVEWAWRSFSRQQCGEEWADPRQFTVGTVLSAFESRLVAA